MAPVFLEIASDAARDAARARDALARGELAPARQAAAAARELLGGGASVDEIDKAIAEGAKSADFRVAYPLVEITGTCADCARKTD